MQVLDNMLEEARNMALALRGPNDLEHAGEESALILCGNSNDRKLWQAQEVTANPGFGNQEGFLEEVLLLTVKNENIYHVIREERGVCKDVATDERDLIGNCRWRVWQGEGGHGRDCYCWG